MHKFIKLFSLLIVFISCGWTQILLSDNQTPIVSPVFPGSELPFRVTVELADFALPNGIHSGSFAVYDDKWLYIGGRTNGLHGFGPTNNFPPQQQNTVVYVIDPIFKNVVTKSLLDPTSGLTQQQVDLLSVTSPQSAQHEKTLYITGGYGVDTATGLFSTKDVLTAIDVPGLMHWVLNASPGETAAQYIRQISNPIFQVTGGYMTRVKKNHYFLIFGQNFTGQYTDNSNGIYSRQVRRFSIEDDGKKLSVNIKNPKPRIPDPNYRRRDLNVVPVMHDLFGVPVPAYVAFSGVFTETGGAWTVPVLINTEGEPSMDNPADPDTFKQAMNNYVCPTAGLFSNNTGNMYEILFGGITYGFFANGTFNVDPELPFTNQITTIRLDKKGNYTQFIMPGEYPTIFSTASNPGNVLLFGAGGDFIPVDDLPMYKNGVLKYDKLGRGPILIGYILGGIQSTLPNTNTMFDSAASPYIFRVILTPL